jgi:hypothetical protein
VIATHVATNERIEMSEKKRYFLGPFDDGEPMALMTLDTALDNLRTNFQECEVDDEFTYRIVEMTDEEVNALPDL